MDGCMRRPSGKDEPSPTLWPRKVLAMAGLFALICFGLSGLAAVQPQRHL